MLYDALVTGSRRNDALDGVRFAALERGRWLVDLLERERADSRWDVTAGPRERARQTVRIEELRAEIRERLAACTDEEGRAAALCLVLAAGFDSGGIAHDYHSRIRTLVSRVRGWTPDEVVAMLLRVSEYEVGYWFAGSLEDVLPAAEQLDADGRRAAAPWLRHVHAEVMGSDAGGARLRAALVKRLRTLLASVEEARIPERLIPGDAPWAAPLRERATAAPAPELAGFVRHLAGLSGPRPSQKWRRTCLALVDAVDARDLVAGILRTLAEGERMCSKEHGPCAAWMGGHHHHYVVQQQDGDLARGAMWAAALAWGAAAVPHLSALALRTGGPRSDVVEDLKLAGAAVNALAAIDDPAALEALWRLRTRIKRRDLAKQVTTALTTAAGRQGITAGQLVERNVPAHGLAPEGSYTRELGGHRVRLAIEDAATVRLGFTRPDGSTSRTAPAAVKDGFPAELAELKARARAVRATLSGERARLEALMSAGRTWPYEEWCRHYRDHPVTGVLVRGLIWEFQDAPDGEWRAVAPGEPPGAPRSVRLWHPIGAPADEIGRWRARVLADRLRQPFKQAFREIYRLTPAEEETRVYSNRFAAHIVHYQRLYALFKERGWQADYLGRHDGGLTGEARAEFSDGQWRAVFHHEPADDAFDWSPAHASTDQVRFQRRDGNRWREVALAEVPALVFSEALRDVDLFVGVTSIAADPEWVDRGENRYAAYWAAAGFGELTAGAEMRREALARIVPRLKIADRCAVEGRFLVVRGSLRTYRIHLGSANVLMEPDGAYLCIVSSRGAGGGKVFLPFEDERLSLILSKAFLLADDDAITDESILVQIKRGA